jgi:dihydrofolate synthase/folylpolyglutamate synthase
MGGRPDSTNVIRYPLLSVITGIALDHTAFLGDTVEKIAAEKAGIIKDGAPVLFGGEDASASAVIEATAKERGSAYHAVDYGRLTHVESTLTNGTHFDFGTMTDLHIHLLGLYQPRNASVVLTAVGLLRTRDLAMPEAAVREGLLAARWPARFEILSHEPLVIFDGAHNPQGIDAAVATIAHYFGDEKVYIMTGVLKDKDYRYIASRLATVASRAFVLTPENPRALDGEEYASILQELGVPSTAYPTIGETYETAKAVARADGKPLLILGSLYTYSAIC